MFIKKYNLRQDYQPYIAAGQISFIMGVLLSRLHESPLLLDQFNGAFVEGRMFQFFVGFLDGFSFALIVASIVLNLRGLMLYRAN